LPGVSVPLALKAGVVFGGRFKLQCALGSGDEGGVWQAEDLGLKRMVTLKLLPEVICRDPDALADLKAVAHRSSALVHANIARTYELVEAEAIAAVALEYVDGKSLTQLRLEKPQHAFEAKELTPWMRSLCEALEYAYRRMNLVHGGLRSDNLLVNTGGQLKLTGFGLAGRIKRWLARLGAGPGYGDGPASHGSVRPAGTEPAVSDDVYGVGSILYELLTGTTPFEGENYVTSPAQVKPAPCMAERRADRGINGEVIPAHWEQTVAACLARDPARRPGSPAELAARWAGLPLEPLAPPVERLTAPVRPLHPSEGSG